MEVPARVLFPSKVEHHQPQYQAWQDTLFVRSKNWLARNKADTHAHFREINRGKSFGGSHYLLIGSE